MGLDMYAYVANKESNHSSDSASQEIAYWRKHPNLHGWMERLAKSKGLDYDTFNGVELELTFDDIMQLEKDIITGNLPSTTGFFFGDDSDEYYKSQDLDFVYEAKSRLFLGQRVFYNSSW
jgi:hypothetical protein